MSVKLLLVLLALWLPACESQGEAARPLHPSERPLFGPARGHAHAQAMLEKNGDRVRAAVTGSTSSRARVADGDEEKERRAPDHGRVLWRDRPRRRITKRQLKRQLEQANAELKACRSSLDTCTTENDLRFLFVQMAETCSMHMDGNRTFLTTTDMDIDTYGFSDKPYRYAATYPTSYFNGYLFNQLFADSPPNAAITFNVNDGEAEDTFEGPVLSILLVSAFFHMEADNSTRVQYEIIQSADQEDILPLSRFFYNGSDSVVFEQCSLFIDTEKDGQQAFFRPRNNLKEASQNMKAAATSLEKSSTGPYLRKYSKIWQINGKGGVDSKDYVKGAADTIRAAASLIEQCKKSCDTKDIVNGVSGIFLASAFVVGAAFPPLGIAMVVIGAIGMLVSALFLDSSVSQVDNTITPSMIQDAVDRALTSFTVQADSETLKSFSTFFKIDINNYVRVAGALGYILEKNPADQATVDQQIQYWYTQQFSPAWTGVYQRGIVDLEAKYTTWFGATNPSGLRYKLKDYKTSCDSNTCKITNGDTSFFADGANRVKNCKQKVDNARSNWVEMGQFANAYLQVASMLSSFSSQAANIFQMSSFCDPFTFSEDVVRAKCKWNFALSDLYSKVARIQARALYLQTVMDELSKECNPSRPGWPFSQYCKSDQECNYKYVLAITNTQYNNRLADTNEEGKFKKLDKSYYASDSKRTCQNIYNWNHGSRGYGFGGLYGYTSSGPTLRRGNCGEIVDTANTGASGYLILGAIPSFCIDDFPKCGSLIATDNLWGEQLD